MTMGKRVRRALSALVLLIILFPWTALPAAAASVGDFTDVSGSDWFYDAVKYAVDGRLFDGTSSTTFSPNDVMTRGMFIKVLGRYAGVNEASWRTATVTGSGVNIRKGPGTSYETAASVPQGGSVTLTGKSGSWYKVSYGGVDGYMSEQYIRPDHHAFSDVDYGQYYAGYAIWAYESGVVTGDGSADRFSPDGVVTREQVCALLDRYASVTGLSVAKTESAVTFPDDGSISSWAKNDVYAMQQAGVVKGHAETGRFEPAGSATRAEVATMFQRFESATGGQTPPAPSGSPSPSPSAPPSKDPDELGVVDAPVSFRSDKVQLRARTIRVGIYVETSGTHTGAAKAVLANETGSGFEVGSMSGRTFTASGSLGAGPLTVTASGGTLSVTNAAGEVVYTSSSPFAIHAVGADKPLTRLDANKDSYCYYGDFEFRPAYGNGGKITIVNYVGLEDYVKGVMPWEFGTWWPSEVMKVAAIACRSFALSYDWSTYSSFGFDLLNGINAQTYHGRGTSGRDSDYTVPDAAVDATENVFLTYDGSVCIACYSSCNGGKVLSAKDGFGVSYPYLLGKDDPYEQAAIQDVGGQSTYKYMASISHRVGLSAWGAYAMDKYYHKDYQTILGFYFPGTSLQYGA